MPVLATAVTFNNVIIANGLRLHFAEQGAADAPVMLMLHGYTDSWFTYSRLLPFTAERFRSIVPDLRGHGESEKPEMGYAIDDFATDALQLMDELKVSRAIVVGHSMGSFVARRVAELAPARVTSLVLLGTASIARNEVVTALNRDVAKVTDPVDRHFIREFQVSMIRRPVPAEFMDEVIRQSAKVPARVWKAALAELLVFSRGTSIHCPTVVIGGADDAVFSRSEQEAVRTVIPGASIHILQGLGHSPQWEDPAAVFERMSHPHS
jgi:non-heme chloroperoxidase